MSINYKSLQAKVVELATRVGSEAVEKFLTAAAAELLKSAGIALPDKAPQEQIEDKTPKAAPKKVAKQAPENAKAEDAEVVKPKAKVAAKAEAEAPKRERATNKEMFERATANYKAAKSDGASKEKLEKLLELVHKYAEKCGEKFVEEKEAAPLKAKAAAPAPAKKKAAPAPEPEEDEDEDAEDEEEDEEEEEETPPPTKKKAAPKAAAPVKKVRKVWDGLIDGSPATPGQAIMLESETFDEPMLYRIVEVDLDGGKLLVFPAHSKETNDEGDHEPDANGILAKTEDESAFSSAWEDVAPDGSNVHLVVVKKKTAKDSKRGSL
jgi:DNA polymerase III gamma/tau subunit